MVAKAVDGWQLRGRSECGDAIPFIEQHTIDKHDDSLDLAIGQSLKCRVKIIGRPDLGGNQLDAQPLTRTLSFLTIDNHATGDIHQQPDSGHIWNQFERKLDLLTRKALNPE